MNHRAAAVMDHTHATLDAMRPWDAILSNEWSHGRMVRMVYMAHGVSSSCIMCCGRLVDLMVTDPTTRCRGGRAWRRSEPQTFQWRGAPNPTCWHHTPWLVLVVLAPCLHCLTRALIARGQHHHDVQWNMEHMVNNHIVNNHMVGPSKLDQQYDVAPETGTAATCGRPHCLPRRDRKGQGMPRSPFTSFIPWPLWSCDLSTYAGVVVVDSEHCIQGPVAASGTDLLGSCSTISVVPCTLSNHSTAAHCPLLLHCHALPPPFPPLHHSLNGDRVGVAAEESVHWVRRSFAFMHIACVVS